MLRYYALILPEGPARYNRKERRKACGSVHTSTPDAISHLGLLYNIEFQGKLDGAEKMYQRATRAWGSADKIYRRKDLILIARASFTNSMIP
jgi:hypothetical protein